MPTPDWRIPQSFEEEPLSSSFGRDLYRQTFVDRAHAAGLAGATVLRGIEGYGASQRVHTTRLLSLTEELPVVIVTVDEADRIERFAVQLDEVITEGLVVIDDVEVVRYVGRQGARGAGESA